MFLGETSIAPTPSADLRVREHQRSYTPTEDPVNPESGELFPHTGNSCFGWTSKGELVIGIKGKILLYQKFVISAMKGVTLQLLVISNANYLATNYKQK